MKRIACIAALFSVLLFALLWAGCAPPAPREEETFVRVVVVENGGPFTPERRVYDVARGEDLVLRLYAEEGYAFDRCDYPSYSVAEGESVCLLTLREVRYPVRVDIRFKHAVTTGNEEGVPDDGFRGVRYYPNGGTFAGEEVLWFEEPFSGGSHLRANTDTGEQVRRDGYTLLGWNTRADGSGEHVGLGSRVTVPEGERALLYAEWAPWTDAALFTWEETEGGAALISYTGEKAVGSLVLPARIGGKEVVRVAAGFAPALRAETLVLPPTLQAVEAGAFAAPQIGEIYLFDNIAQISDACFAGGEGIATVHINAARKPCFIEWTDNSFFAEGMDRLILNADKKKMVFFAGCSFSYGLDSPMVEYAFGGEYVVCNMGITGGTNATFQLDCITRYLGEGDVFIHAPEEMNPHQLLHTTSATTRMFQMVESNYDLLAMADLSGVEGFWDAFAESNALRDELTPGEYTDRNSHYNEYGDIDTLRPDSPPGSRFETKSVFRPDYVGPGTASLARLNEYYGRIEDKGARVFFSYAPANASAFSAAEYASRSWETFDAFIRGGLDARFPVISAVEDYILDGQYFFDTDYHLTVHGAQLRTQRLIDDIRVALAKEREGGQH